MCHDSERKPASRDTHKLSSPEGEKWDQVRTAKASEPGVLTSCGGKRRDRQVSEKTLERGHSLSVKRRRRNESGQRIKPASEGHSRTFEQLRDNIRTEKETRRVRGTHVQALSSTDGGTTGSQHSRRKPASEGNSRPVEHIWSNKSAQRRKAGERWR